jgi:hypothetical protein
LRNEKKAAARKRENQQDGLEKREKRAAEKTLSVASAHREADAAKAANEQSCVVRRVRGRVAYSVDLRVHHGVRCRIKVTPETGMGDGPAITREIAAQPDAQA